MSNVIQLLPDSVANQIAAGEVVQRPASVIKELMENSVDAGAKEIQVVTAEAGKTLIQVIDDGCGMTQTDARMAFERHATSKIREASDLFALRTMGFRGEALASIAAIAHVELKTRKEDEELGVHICVAGSKVESQELVQCAVGSQFVVKNLFYNVPARRRFLKKNSTELRHIINEFQRVALANPGVAMSLIHNNVSLFNLPAGNIKQRVVNMLGRSMGEQVIPIDSETITVTIKGFIGKPESARKTMGDQFFFVNNRYMKHPYLHKAVMDAYSNILAIETVPAYFIFLEVDPNTVDVNIHPTKTEIKFEDERTIWQILNATIRESLGKFNVMPSIDFDVADQVHIPVMERGRPMVEPGINFNPDYNPFEEEKKKVHASTGFSGGSSHRSVASRGGWQGLSTDFHGSPDSFAPTQRDFYEEEDTQPVQQTILSAGPDEKSLGNQKFYQLKSRYILTSVKSGLMMIDQRRAHERITFERFMTGLRNGASLSQKCLFPETLTFGPQELEMVRELMPDFKLFGLELKELMDGKVDVLAVPSGLEKVSAAQLIDGILTDFRDGEVDVEKELKEQIAAALAKRAAVSYGKVLTESEMSELFDQLFACAVPNYAPNGKPVISILDNDELARRFM